MPEYCTFIPQNMPLYVRIRVTMGSSKLMEEPLFLEGLQEWGQPYLREMMFQRVGATGKNALVLQDGASKKPGPTVYTFCLT